jgi:hypothetical protein
MTNEVDNFLATNQRLRSLFLILIFTFVASGITLAVLAQIHNYENEQVSFNNSNQVKISLPEKHKVQTNLLKIEN